MILPLYPLFFWLDLVSMETEAAEEARNGELTTLVICQKRLPTI